jgi:hypothetical protein
MFILVMHGSKTTPTQGKGGDAAGAKSEMPRSCAWEDASLKTSDHILTRSDMTAASQSYPAIIPCRDPPIGIRHAWI